MGVSYLTDFVWLVGSISVFLGEIVLTALRKGVRIKSVVLQMYVVGVRSVPTTMIAGLFVGGILALQLNDQLQDYGAQSVLGGLTASTLIRNVGPVLIAFMLSGKVGAYTTAELSSMRVTQQMDAIRCLGADPIELILVPRLCAVTLASFCLLVIGLMVGLLGGLAISSVALQINPMAYVQRIPEYVSAWSVGTGLIKSVFYGLVIGVMSCYRGFFASGGASGVGVAVKKSAVDSLVLIIVLDFLLSMFSEFIYELFQVGYA